MYTIAYEFAYIYNNNNIIVGARDYKYKFKLDCMQGYNLHGMFNAIFDGSEKKTKKTTGSK